MAAQNSQHRRQQQEDPSFLRQLRRAPRRYTPENDMDDMVTFPYYFYRRPTFARRRPFLSSWRRVVSEPEQIGSANTRSVMISSSRTMISSTSTGSPQGDEYTDMLLDTTSDGTRYSIDSLNDDIDVTHHRHHSNHSQHQQPYYTTESLIQLLRAVRAHDPNVQRIYLNGKRNQPQLQQQQVAPRDKQRHYRFFPAAYLTALLKALRGNPYVTHLTLSHAISPKEDATPVVAALRGYLQTRAGSNLVHLDLSRNHFQAKDIQHIFGNAKGSKTTTTTSPTCTTTATTLQLRKLNLEGNTLGDAGVQALCTALSSSTKNSTSDTASTTANISAPLLQVSIHKLGRTQMTAVGLQAVVNLLLSQRQEQTDNNNARIRSLDLRGNHLGTTAGLLAHVLCRADCWLETLSLRNNDLDNGVVTRLAQALETNTNLQTLDLQHNEGLDCGAALCRALRANHTFTKLKLRHTGVNAAWKNELLDALLINTHGPELARQTKSALEQIVALQQKQRAKKTWTGSATYRTKSTGCNPMLKREQKDDTEGTDLMSDEDEDNEDDKKWMESWRIAAQSNRLTKRQQCGQQQQTPFPECVVCCTPMEESALLLPCTHHNCCLDCGKRLKDCHMCRQVVVKVWPLPVWEATDSNLDGLFLPPFKPND